MHILTTGTGPAVYKWPILKLLCVYKNFRRVFINSRAFINGLPCSLVYCHAEPKGSICLLVK